MNYENKSINVKQKTELEIVFEKISDTNNRLFNFVNELSSIKNRLVTGEVLNGLPKEMVSPVSPREDFVGRTNEILEGVNLKLDSLREIIKDLNQIV